MVRASGKAMETAVEVPTSRLSSVTSKIDSFSANCRGRSVSVGDQSKTLKPANSSSTPSPLVKKMVQRQVSVSNQNQPPVKNAHGKRRQSFGCVSDYKNPYKRRRRGDVFTPPTKFLLGGNINDPLNLESLADEEVSKKANEVTPQSSPVPTPKHRNQVEVLIPPNINDPLNLNSGEDIEFNLISPRSKKRRRRHKRKSECEDEAAQPAAEVPETDKPANVEEEQTPQKLTIQTTPAPRSDEKVVDKIVSPVVPQGSPVKFPRRSVQEKHAPGQQKKPWGKQKSQKVNAHVYFREKDAHFQYGNYNRYYGYRNRNCEDSRLKLMRPKWFRGKDVLDIGCNVGHFTLSIARDFCPRKVIGLDIDGKLIKAARKNVRHYLTTELAGGLEFPISMAICHGPIAAAALPGREKEPSGFPNNVFFVQGNYVLENDLLLETQRPEFDTILCLSLTKWVHLNWGDDGLKRVFKRLFAQLRPGGRMILEAQPWHSYAKKKKLTEQTYKNYHAIKLRPEHFSEYLLSSEIGFSTCELVDTPAHASKGFQRPIYLFKKSKLESDQICDTSPPVVQPEYPVEHRPSETE